MSPEPLILSSLVKASTVKVDELLKPNMFPGDNGEWSRSAKITVVLSAYLLHLS